MTTLKEILELTWTVTDEECEMYYIELGENEE